MAMAGVVRRRASLSSVSACSSPQKSLQRDTRSIRPGAPARGKESNLSDATDLDNMLRRAELIAGMARNADSIAVDDDRIVPVTLDVTNRADVEAAAAACGDSTLVINNAGLMLASALHFGAQRGCGAWRNGDQLLRNPGSRASLRTRARREWWWRTGEHAHAHDEWHRQVI